MAATERAVTTQRGLKPLSEYPGPQSDIAGSVMRRGPDGEWVRNYYYHGHIDVPGGEHTIGYSGRETRVEHPQQPMKAKVVFDVKDRQPVQPIPMRRGNK